MWYKCGTNNYYDDDFICMLLFLNLEFVVGWEIAETIREEKYFLTYQYFINKERFFVNV